MEKIAASLPPNTFGIRDLSLMTLHFAIAGREHELAHLRVRDITEDPEGRGLEAPESHMRRGTAQSYQR